MTDFTDLTDAADVAADLDLPFHYGPDVRMPCFACFIESMLEAVDDGFDTADEKQAAIDLAVTQIADCMGVMFLQLAVDAPGSVAIFTERIQALVGANTDTMPAAMTAPAPHKHHH